MLREAVSLLTPTGSHETFALFWTRKLLSIPKPLQIGVCGGFAFSGATRLVISVVNRSPAQYRIGH